MHILASQHFARIEAAEMFRDAARQLSVQNVSNAAYETRDAVLNDGASLRAIAIREAAWRRKAARDCFLTPRQYLRISVSSNPPSWLRKASLETMETLGGDIEPFGASNGRPAYLDPPVRPAVTWLAGQKP